MDTCITQKTELTPGYFLEAPCIFEKYTAISLPLLSSRIFFRFSNLAYSSDISLYTFSQILIITPTLLSVMHKDIQNATA